MEKDIISKLFGMKNWHSIVGLLKASTYLLLIALGTLWAINRIAPMNFNLI